MSRNNRIGFLLSLGLLIAACSPQAAITPTSTAKPLPTPTDSNPQMGCSTVKAAPTPDFSGVLTAVTEKDFARGPAAAPVTLLAYCDYQSAQCELFSRVLDQLEKEHAKELRVVLRPFPVPASVVPALDKSQASVQAALAAGNQDKFWEMSDLLHMHYNDWANLPAAQFESWVTGQAPALGLDLAKFRADLNSPETKARSESLYQSATGLGISAIPTVFINGSLQQRPALSYEGLDATISLIALGARQFTSCPPFAIDPARQYSATIHTEKGDIFIRLFADKAPLAVNSFVFLAQNKWFDGVTFHRVIPGFMAQTGDPSGTGRGGPGYVFKNEINAGLNFDKPGVLGMANSGLDANGSQFFITYAPATNLDGSFTVFGQVTQGMDVLESLTPRDPLQNPGLPPGDRIISVTIEVK